jgi:hypothetical protein
MPEGGVSVEVYREIVIRPSLASALRAEWERFKDVS